MIMTSYRILCVENDAVLESRCAVLELSGYDTSAASVQAAEFLLSNQEFDLIVLSANLSEKERQWIVAGAGSSTRILALNGFTLPSELISMVAEQLHHGAARTA
jgi:CheY-like chemotaxis protein